MFDLNKAKEIFPGKGYYATKDGLIISTKYRKGHGIKTLIPFMTNSGYLAVGLSINGKCQTSYIHRLVAIAYIPNPENKPEVNHIDGNKMNNNVNNLEWVTANENCSHYRNLPVNIDTQTSGRSGSLYHELHFIGRFRSLQQAKLYCKTHYSCSLSTAGTTNINTRHHLFYLRDSIGTSIDEVWADFLAKQNSIEKEVSDRNKTQKGIGGCVYNGPACLGNYRSIREANKTFQCDFKKKGSFYQSGSLLFYPNK